jgi:DNA primase
MSGRISEQTLEEIRARTDIVELIGSRIPLKRASADFKACCPFHKEKTPSFIVSPARRTFHCFGCGAHGDVFKYLMMADGMTFVDAVRFLAQRCGVTLDMAEDYEAVERGLLMRINAELAAFYQRCLRQIAEASKARDYLASRKLDGETAERFGIGYAPDRQGTILAWAAKHKYTAEQLVTVGVLTPPKEGRRPDDYYDRFHGRLMFPIRYATGQVIGFSGRILSSDAKAAKYVNSPETPVFHKGSVLYALDFARKNIVRDSRREALVCEGQIDVIRCHASGFGNAVASQGTAFTEEHVKLLKRYADSALLVFDGDAAGLHAAVRTGRLFLQEGMPVQVASLPPGEDPDSIIRDKGPDAFRAIIDKPESLVTFQIRSMRAAEALPDALDARARLTAQVIETVTSCSQAVMRSYLEQEAAQQLGVPLDALQSDIAAYQEKKVRFQGGPGTVPAVNSQPSNRPTDKPTNRQTVQPPIRPTVQPSNRHTIKPTESPLFSLAQLLLQTENNEALVARVAEWLPEQIMGDSLEAQAVNAALADAQDGTSYIADLTENGEPAMKALLERLSTQEAKALSSRELTPVDAANDLITRVWIDYLRKQRDGLDLAKPDECKRRFELSATIKALESTHDWDRRANIIYPEFERLAQAADTVSVEPQQ